MRMQAMIKVCNQAVLVRAFSSKASGSSSSGKSGAPSPKPAGTIAPSPKPASSTTSSAGAVSGLSNNVLSVPNTEVGPGASKNSNYKNPEYFSYHTFSYAEAEVEMIKFRLPQPSNRA